MTYQSFGVTNFRSIPQVQQHLTEDEQFRIEVAAQIFPFKVNNYVINELINWDNWRNDSMFALTFPAAEMLQPVHFHQVQKALQQNWSKEEQKVLYNSIRMRLNPNPADQMNLNVPLWNGEKLKGMQHKYDQTLLFFPSQGQTCHAYCTFCFRWPQFAGMHELKFAMNETDLLVEYLKSHPAITDVLITGGDPLRMSTALLKKYITAIMDADLPHVQTIRLGTKALSYWPYRFLTDKDGQELLRLFKWVNTSGKKIAFMAHFNHTRELETAPVQQAIEKILETNTVIRTQSPLMQHINDSAAIWTSMWNKQTQLGLVPYYMFLARDTGAQHHFAVPLYKAFEIFSDAYKSVSGIARTVRGPSMSTSPGKVQITGITTIGGEKVFVLNFIQARNQEWVQQPFFAKYNETAIWLDDLQPAFNESSFFFEGADKVELVV